MSFVAGCNLAFYANRAIIPTGGVLLFAILKRNFAFHANCKEVQQPVRSLIKAILFNWFWFISSFYESAWSRIFPWKQKRIPNRIYYFIYRLNSLNERRQRFLSRLNFARILKILWSFESFRFERYRRSKVTVVATREDCAREDQKNSSGSVNG